MSGREKSDEQAIVRRGIFLPPHLYFVSCASSRYVYGARVCVPSAASATTTATSVRARTRC